MRSQLVVPFSPFIALALVIVIPLPLPREAQATEVQFTNEIASGEYTAGVQTVVWDGRNARGERIATGVYFVRARSGG